jgi:hypothetical protein
MPERYQPKHRKSAHNHPPHLQGDREECVACAEEHAELVRRVRSGMERRSS